jgi:uncharacterized transporter YbjL
MRWIVRRAVVTLAFASAGAVAALLFTSGTRALVVDVYVVVVAGIVMLALFRVIRSTAPLRPSMFEQALAAARAGAPQPSTEVEDERDVVLSRLNAFHYHIRVRPVLRELAEQRLRTRFGVELDREAERARELVPSDAWDVVRPDTPPPEDRLARGPSLERQRVVIEELERLGS